MIDLSTFEFPDSVKFENIVQAHIDACNEYFSVIRPSRSYRAETEAEGARRRYWQKKTGKKFGKLEFWTIAPTLSAEAVIVSSVEEAAEKFGSAAQAPKARRYKIERKERKLRKVNYVVLKPRNFIRVRVLPSGQNGVITAYGEKGYRVTIDPKVKWKSKFRRWLSASDFQVLDGKGLPQCKKNLE